MTGVGPLTFLDPMILSALLLLPVIWLIVRTLPPPVRSILFPPLGFLKGLQAKEPPPDKAPPWIVALRVVIGALLIAAFARPVWNAEAPVASPGAIMVVIDDGWETASRWPDRLAAVEAVIANAERSGRPVIIARTSVSSDKVGVPTDVAIATKFQPQSASELRERLGGLKPVPWSPDHRRMVEALNSIEIDAGQIVWFSDGVERAGTSELREQLMAIAALEIRVDPPARFPQAVLPPVFDGLDIIVSIARPARAFASEAEIEALAADGRRLSSVSAAFPADAELATARLSLPQGIRNEVAFLGIAGDESAGSIVALDVRAGRPLVGIVENRDPSQTLLRTPEFFLSRALEPFSALITGSLTEIMAEKPSLLFLADYDLISDGEVEAVSRWIDQGGVLVRFAGPRMATDAGPLTPVPLRSGGRSFGGAFTWDSPKRLRSFSEASPFFGLSVPEDVAVTRQLLAAPGPELAGKTWAALEDGTPLVTAERRGNGRIILFHTTANADWSDLALSGLYVGMLQRILPFARTARNADLSGAPEFLSPIFSFDGFGKLELATPTITPIRRDYFNEAVAGPGHPPGLYGPEGMALALNLANSAGPVTDQFRFAEIARKSWNVIEKLGASEEQDLAPLFLVTALILVLLDILAGRWLMGRPLFGSLRYAGALVLLAAITAPLGQSAAQELDDEFVLDATRQTRLAWVPTEDPTLDATIEAGLKGLARIIRVRTAVQLGEAVAIDPEQDSMALFSLIYWPVAENTDASLRARRRLAEYLETGGMVLFDAGVGDPALSSLGLERPQSRDALARVLRGITIPRLATAASDHVLSRSFYLLDRFPGRIRGRPIWVEDGTANNSGLVSRVVIGAGDWPSAWAVDDRGLPVVRDLPGGEGQREMAYRFGINLVMYALTGTYKDDQLHLPLIMGRLGE